MKIWVSGIGLVSSIGMNVRENLASLRKEERGLGHLTLLDSIHKESFYAGEVKLSNHKLGALLSLSEEASGHYSRTSLLGMLAAKEALASAGINRGEVSGTALVSATTVGGMDLSEKAISEGADPRTFLHTHPCGDSTDRIAEYTGIDAYRTTLSTACSSGANAIIHGARLIRNGIVERVVAGGVDALSKFTLNGFNSLMILDHERCRPYDQSRRGLNLGEGAGFLVMESDALVQRRKARTICHLSGYANANDAYHQTASSPDGEAAFMAMTQALEKAGLSPGDINYINVHGTGTENNDASEGAALIRVFGKDVPAFSSTKSFTGHTLGAAAGLEAVFSVMSIREGMIPSNPGFEHPVEGLELIPETSFRDGVKIKHVLSNSFGFGGNNSSLVFSKS